MSGRPPRLRR